MRILIFSCVPLLLSRGSIVRAQLKITEVLIDGTDEFIELTNRTDRLFSGTVSLSGAKSSLLSLSVSVSGGETIVIGDALAYLDDEDVVIYPNNGLSLKDTSALSLSLFSGSFLFDSVEISEQRVVSLDNQKISFEWREDKNSFTGTSAARSFAVSSPFLANPGKVFSPVLGELADNNLTVDVSSTGADLSGSILRASLGSGSSYLSGADIFSGVSKTISTGIVLGSGATEDISGPAIQFSDLIISEVFVDGTDERIEISNLGPGSFSGSIELLGVKSSTLEITDLFIESEESVIIADKVAAFIDTGSLVVLGAGLHMGDTKELHVSLSVAGQKEDEFIISEADVLRFDNQKRSFQKLLRSGSYVIAPTWTGQVDNVHSPLIANPGSLKTVVVRPEILRYDKTQEICPTLTGVLELSEIAWHGDVRYIELKVLTGLVGSYWLSGSLINEPIQLGTGLTNLSVDHRIVLHDQTLSKSFGKLNMAEDILWGSGGYLSIYGHSGHVLDTAMLSGLVDTHSYYAKDTDSKCSRTFESSSLASPGFDESILSFLPKEKELVSATCPVVSVSPVPDTVDISIRSIVADPEGDILESLGLRLDRGPESLSLEDYYVMIGERKRYLHGTLLKGDTVTISQNFGFPNTRGECVSLYDHQGELLDDICYQKDEVSGISFDQKKEEALAEFGSMDELIPHITIESLVYDPPGRDTDKEIIELKNHNAFKYDTKELWLQVGERQSKTYIYDDLRENEHKDMVGNFRLPNTKATCVMLMYQLSYLDTYCYDPSKEQKSEKEKANTKGKGEAMRKLKIQIEDVVYDPEGDDRGRESITFSLSGSRYKEDLSNYYLLLGKTKKKLEGEIHPERSLSITKTRGFPNKKITCITLMRDEKPYDVFCYDPLQKQREEELQKEKEQAEKENQEKEREEKEGLEKAKKELEEGGSESRDDQEEVAAMISTGNAITAKILSLLANAYGKDTGKEYLQISLNDEAILSDLWVSINGKKKKPKWSLVGSGVYESYGSFQLPNRTACVDLFHEKKRLDRLCYLAAKEGQSLDKTQEKIEELLPETLSLLNTLSIKQGEESCIRRRGLSLYCKETKGKTKNGNQYADSSFYRSYISQLHNYLYHNRKQIYYSTDLQIYTQTYRSLHEQIKEGKSFYVVAGKRYEKASVETILDDQQIDSYYERAIKSMEKRSGSEQK